MRSVILISPSDKEVERLYQQWKDKGTNIYVDSASLAMNLNGASMYVDAEVDGDLRVCYEEDELAHVDISTPSFYLISYADRDVMKYFIDNSIFGEGSYMDNDHGRIIRVDELRKEEILDFIE